VGAAWKLDGNAYLPPLGANFFPFPCLGPQGDYKHYKLGFWDLGLGEVEYFRVYFQGSQLDQTRNEIAISQFHPFGVACRCPLIRHDLLSSIYVKNFEKIIVSKSASTEEICKDAANIYVNN